MFIFARSDPMSDLLRTLAAYVPPNIIRDTLTEANPAPPTTAWSDRFEAAVLFADVSGFTPLTEALARKGAEGPEELTRLLNTYFSRMIDLIEGEGGEVVKFSGDAVTVLFPASTALPPGADTGQGLACATRRAKQAAEAMQAAMVEFATIETSAGPVALGMKIGIGAGEILAILVGGVFNRWEYVIAGDPLRQVAEAEHQAERGDVILSPEAETLLWPEPLVSQPLTRPEWDQIQNPGAVEAVLRSYVPAAVANWLGEGLHEWLAVLRPMSVLFVGVGGLDYSQPDAVERLHTFLRAAQETIYSYEGSINKLAVDDKGTIFIALFGAPPYAHEDDPERALHCAMDLQHVATAQGLQLAIGVTTGRVFSGPVGSDTRREYTVMGDTVNLSARLMVAAGMGDIRCDFDTFRRTRNRLSFDLFDPIRVKGKAGLIRIYRPVAQYSESRRSGSGGRLIGRQAELARLTTELDALQQERTRVLMVEGEAGIGKSRLVAELGQLMDERGLTGLLGAGRSIEQQTPYRAWRDIFNTYFGLDEESNTQAERQQQVREQVEEFLPELVDRLPLLNDVLSLGLPENELTASLDIQLRHESLVSLLLELLRVWARERPLVLILEDSHWLDTLSWELALQAVRSLDVARMPLLLLVVMRPLEEGIVRPELQALVNLDQTDRLHLTSLSPDETVLLAATRLGVTADGLPQVVARLVHERAGGNPFYAEELVYALRDNDLIEVTDGGCVVSGDLAKAEQALPDNIQGLVLSRIDRLPPEKQLTLKVAAVIGRTFAYTTLSDTLRNLMAVTGDLLKDYLEDLDHLDLTPLDVPEPELTYIFKHIITQEVAYETLLFAQRRQLHGSVADWYERHFDPDGQITPAIRRGDYSEQMLESPLAPYCPLLVYHSRQADDENRERSYARLAGQWAAAQYANTESVGYLGRALELTPENDVETRYDLLLAREAVNDLRGERDTQRADLELLTEVIDQMAAGGRRAEISLRRANYAETISDYPVALAAAEEAIVLARQSQDQTRETRGHIARGIVLWRQGEYRAAQEPLERALTLAEANQDRFNEARSLYYLGDVYLYQNNYDRASEYFDRALSVYRLLGHVQGEGDSLNNLGVIQNELGDLSRAIYYYEQVINVFRKTGDRRGESLSLGNLGVNYCDLGDFEAARGHLVDALNLRREIGDRWGEGLSITNLALVEHSLGNNQLAREHGEAALEIQRTIGDQRLQAFSLTYLGHALTTLGELSKAEEAYSEAARLRRELGQQPLVIDDLAGLARVAMARGDTARARERVDDILTWIGDNGTAGIEYPLQVNLTCYQVLTASANGDASALEQANAILATAHTAMQEQAAGIGDDTLRRSFLENIPAHRDLVAAWQAR
jgi:predicted ATPase/class 3 adenylate cyclase